jgi:hypothetical protein
MYPYIYIENLRAYNPSVSGFLTASSWGSGIQVRPTTSHGRGVGGGAPIIDRHDRIFSGEGCCASSTVTPTFYKNKKICANRSVYKNAYQIIVHMKNFQKNKSCIGCIAWHGILYFSKILGEPRRI